MEQKNNMLNQLAVITDLIEKLDINHSNSKVMFNLNKENFEKLFNSLHDNQYRRIETPKESFTIRIETIDFIFNMNNV
jgi:hypothetical protein